MADRTCLRCSRPISWSDRTIFDGRGIVHSDCRRPSDLSRGERLLLVRHCWSHAIAECAACSARFLPRELGSDLLNSPTLVCPCCRGELITSLRAHLYVCPVAANARDATRKLVRESLHLSDIAASRKIST